MRASSFRLLTIALLALPAAGAQDTRALADGLVRELRARQDADGGYGGDLVTTGRALSALQRSPRRYTELDGPFFRRAAELVAHAPAGSVPDALVSLALADTLTPALQRARDEALARVFESTSRTDDDLLALRVFRVEGVDWPAPAADDGPARAVLLAEDPAEVVPPPLEPLATWAAWARATRVRGHEPLQLPDLSVLADPAAAPSVVHLLADLELVLACHGLFDARPPPALGDEELPAQVEPGQTVEQALARAADFLDRHQHGGTFGLDVPGFSGPEPGITALALSAAQHANARLGRPQPEWIDHGLDYLVSLQLADGSIQATGLPVYTTSVAIEALLDGGRAPDLPVVERARDFLVLAQSDEGEGYAAEADAYYGGVGYGNDERPDLSNTQMALEAAARAGLPSGHPFFAKAAVFLERCQNWGEGQPLTWPRPGGGTLLAGIDGGSTYMPGNSPAGEIELAPGSYQARSYGSMTYALTKSFLLCGRTPEDARVGAALRWLGQNFTLENNPGFVPADKGADGLYYYYLALARTLARLPEDALRDAEGRVIDGRARVVRHLLDQQRTDGSWINERSPRWWEGAPPLATAYAVLALQAAGA